MVPTVKHFPATADPHDVLQYIAADGAVVIEGATTRESIDTVLEELGTVQGGRTYGLAAKSQTFAMQLLMNLLYIDLVKRILTYTSIIYYEQERTVSTSNPKVSHVRPVRRTWSSPLGPPAAGRVPPHQPPCEA